MGAASVQDCRGGRLVAVIECLLNQNARDAGAADSPAMNRDVVQLCLEHDVGLLQMPCPEIVCLGWERARRKGESIRDALDTAGGRARCAEIAGDVADRLDEYVRHGFRVLAILGGNPSSPGCAVHLGGTALLPASGVFVRALEAELHRRHIAIPFRGIRDHDPASVAEDLAWLRGVLAAK